MSEYKKEIFNAETGESKLVDCTPEEIAQIKIWKQEAEARNAEIAAKENQRKALLERLGLTAEEVDFLING